MGIPKARRSAVTPEPRLRATRASTARVLGRPCPWVWLTANTTVASRPTTQTAVSAPTVVRLRFDAPGALEAALSEPSQAAGVPPTAPGYVVDLSVGGPGFGHS
jgi:hypothetical protein